MASARTLASRRETTERSVHRSCDSRRKPYFATAVVPKSAKSAMATADGIVVLLPPASMLLMSGPKSAVSSTTSHIAVIASDAHMSRASSHHGRPVAPEGSCEMVVMAYLLLVDRMVRRVAPPWIRRHPDRRCPELRFLADAFALQQRSVAACRPIHAAASPQCGSAAGSISATGIRGGPGGCDRLASTA